jgi:hypothetical protein
VRFKSKAQRRKFAELLVKGEITPDVYERWNRDTGRSELPERAKSARKKGKAKPRRARGTTPPNTGGRGKKARRTRKS